MDRRKLLYAVGAAAVVTLASHSEAQETPEHTAWVGHVLQRMLTIKPGMTRGQLLKIFTTEGGFYPPHQLAYVSRDCPYFKVLVAFRAVGRPPKSRHGRMTLSEGNEDTILKICEPYLQFTIMD